MKKVLLVVLVMFVGASTGCISAAVARASARGREVLKGGTSKEAITAHFGAPESAVPDWLKSKASARLQTGETWTVWKIRGRPAQVDDGGGQATVSALTLGAGEVILLPMTLFGVGADAFKTFYLVGIFDQNDKMRRHMTYKTK